MGSHVLVGQDRISIIFEAGGGIMSQRGYAASLEAQWKNIEIQNIFEGKGLAMKLSGEFSNPATTRTVTLHFQEYNKQMLEDIASYK